MVTIGNAIQNQVAVHISQIHHQLIRMLEIQDRANESQCLREFTSVKARLYIVLGLLEGIKYGWIKTGRADIGNKILEVVLILDQDGAEFAPVGQELAEQLISLFRYGLAIEGFDLVSD